jgi:ubiquinone/menaquinone biosynthesis C-methylase UbiE
MAESPLYDRLGKGYNATRKADPYIAGRLFSLLSPQPKKKYLDIGCGTGNYTIALHEMGVDMTGIDPSDLMLQEAKSKNPDIRWVNGTAENIPLPDNSMSGAIATLTIHHWTDLDKSFSDVARVLKPGSRLVVFTFTPEQENGYWFNYFFPEMMARCQRKAVKFDRIQKAATNAGLQIIETEKYFVHDDLQDMFGYSGKHNPEIYFNPAIRNGISSFASLADKDEVTEGLKKLRQYIESGEFETIKQQYDNPNGDYLFIMLKKKNI